MRIRVVGMLLFGLVAGCSSNWDSGQERGAATSSPKSSSASSLQHSPASRRSHAGFASLPDHGNLVAYERAVQAKESGAYTSYPVNLSEAHALRAIVDGEMVVTTPDGRQLRLGYERHVEHPDGNWSWIGRDKAGNDAVVTFGEKAVFGSIPDGDNPPLRLTMASGRGWMVATDPKKVATLSTRKPDYLVPPSVADAALSGAPQTASLQAESATAAASTTIDVMLGYTAGLAASLGGPSQAVTRLNNLVDITNQAYANSQISQRIRLVHTLQVNYPDATTNTTALEELTGFRNGSAIPVPAALAPLRDARNQYGADLVSLVRDFQAPQNDGCGIAWLIGGDQSPVQASDEPFGYSVIGNGLDVNESDGQTYTCREETLAHEFGHNMGQAHNSEDSSSIGAHPYSYGYREASASGFYTVMAYKLPSSNQFGIRHFANPGVAYAGRPTGVANASDNALSMNQTMPIIATFRAMVAPTPPLDLFTISKMGGSSWTEAHVLNSGTAFQSFTRQLATAIGQTGTDFAWQFQLGDYNRDGNLDLYAIAKLSGSGSTEVHVLNGADGFRSFLLHAATVLHQTGADNGWVFRVGDYNRDGLPDVYALGRNGASGRTEAHVLDGATNFRSFLTHVATALPATGKDSSWDFALGDFNRDGILDVFTFSKMGGSGTTEVHVLNGANAFQTFLLQTRTALHQTGTSNAWVFRVGDYNGDGSLDVYAIAKQGASAKTEVHVLDGASAYLAFSAHIATTLNATGADDAWEFELGR